MATCLHLSANKWTVAKLYNKDHPQECVECCMERSAFISVWHKIATCGLPKARDEAANGEIPLWEDVQAKVNSQFRAICIEGRAAHQSYVIDDHKLHCEVNPYRHNEIGIKILKHVLDNRWGAVVDTIVCTATLLVANLQVAIKGRRNHDNLRNQLFASAFGRNPYNPPNLQNMEFHGDRGYFSENAFLAILLITGCALTCTCPRGIWIPFHTERIEGDLRIFMQEDGMMYCEVREREFRAEGRAIKLAVVAFRNSNGKVVLVASSMHRRLKMDFVTTTERIGNLWKNNKDKLIEEAFGIIASAATGVQKMQIHSEYFALFLSLPVTVVTAFQGYREWHIARMFRLTSTTSHALVKALLRHGLDLQYDFVRVVCEYMCKHYNYERRLEEQARNAPAPEESDDAGSIPSEDYSDDYLLEYGVPDLAQPTNEPLLHVRLDMLRYSNGSLSRAGLESIVRRADDDYLRAFLQKAGMAPAKIPKSNKPMIDRCLQWAAESNAERRPFVLLTGDELKDKYREIKGQNAKSSWNKAELINKILQPAGADAPRRSNEAKDPDDLLQELVNIVVRSTRLKPLEGAAKENCKKGHDMEPEIARQLIAMGDAYPHGTIEEISRMGSVQRDGFEVATDSIDSHMGVNDAGRRYLQLMEYKTRVSIDKARREEDRIDELRGMCLMEEESIFCTTQSDDPDRFLYIEDEKELAQILHHAFVHSRDSCDLAVANTKVVLSCTRMCFTTELLEAYHKTLELISGMCLEPFHRATGAELRKDLTASEDFMAAVKHAVEVVNVASVVDMKTFNFNLKMHRVATQLKNLPLPPCRYIVPLAHAYWNSVKGGSDINTQQLWENNFIAPVHSLHCSVVKQMGILQPVYQIHRLSQVMSNGVENLESFSSAMTYRKHLRSGHPMWWTIRSIEEDVQSMV